MPKITKETASETKTRYDDLPGQRTLALAALEKRARCPKVTKETASETKTRYDDSRGQERLILAAIEKREPFLQAY